MTTEISGAAPSDLDPSSFEGPAGRLFRSLGADGVLARTGLFEDVVERLARLISRQREPGTEVLRFPPVMSRGQLERSGFLKSFPNLLGSVCALHGTEAEIAAAAARHEQGEDWTSKLGATDLVLTPAACYPVYPLAASRGVVPDGGLRFDVAAECFRHEPSARLDRLQSFRMREYVCIGSADEVTAFRQRWLDEGDRLATRLGLPHTIVKASDPFFGRVGQVRGIAQLQQSLKLELLAPVQSATASAACMSFNYHQDHFGGAWQLRTHAGAIAHTACAAFGMDRLAISLFTQHGLETSRWAAGVRDALGFS